MDLSNFHFIYCLYVFCLELHFAYENSCSVMTQVATVATTEPHGPKMLKPILLAVVSLSLINYIAVAHPCDLGFEVLHAIVLKFLASS